MARFALLLLVALPIAVATRPARAAEDPSPFGGEMRLQLGFGGEQVASVEYSDGSRSDLKLGTYGLLGLGGIYNPWPSARHTAEFELFAGFGTWATGPQNTDDRVSLLRFPIEALAYYRYGFLEAKGEEMLLRAGGGVSWHLVDSISGSGSLEGLDYDVNNAIGPVVEAAFVYTILATGVRYTFMKYEIAATGESLDASSIGIFVCLMLEPGLL